MNFGADLFSELLGLITGVSFAGIFGRPEPKPKETETEIWKSPIVTKLREQIQEMEKKYREQVEFFVNFPEVVKTLTGAITIDQVNAAVSRGISALLGSKEIGIFIAHSQDMFRLVDGVGFREELRGRFDCPIQESTFLPILEYRGVSELKDHPNAQAFLSTLGLSAEIAAPVLYGNRLLGLIAISRPTIDRQMGTRVFAMIADMMSVSLHAAGLVQEIRKQAERDALTGLANRRTLMARVTSEIQRSKSYQSKIALCMIDVDNFKHYNDHNGHQAGDETLKKVSSLLAGTIRRTDLAARYGGEEFTVMLQVTDSKMAQCTAERIRQAIANTTFPHGEHQPLGIVSISIGVASFPEDARTVETLFKAADSALYKAKENGRNQVVMYSSNPKGIILQEG